MSGRMVLTLLVLFGFPALITVLAFIAAGLL